MEYKNVDVRNQIAQSIEKSFKQCERSKSGLSAIDTVTLYLYSDAVVPKHPTKDLVLKGECSFEFDNGSDASISASFKEFKHTNKPKTVMECHNLMFGGLPHIEISAR